jgi:hypothetical protein
MKTILLTLPATLAFLAITHTAFAQGTAFTYQGRLNSGGSPANGNYDLQFTLYDAANGGTQQGNILAIAPTAASNGLFTVTLDFGNQFNGTARWLAIGVRTNGSVSAYTVLSPREQLTPTPYAITAGNVTGSVPAGQLTGTLPSANLAGTYSGALILNNASDSFTGDGSGLINVNAGLLGGLSAGQFWKLAGNGGTTPGVNFVGTTDNQPLELDVNSQRALRLEPGGPSAALGNGIPTGAPNVIGGSPVNFVASGVVGATIAGGGATNYNGFSYANSVSYDFGTIGGGYNNATYGPVSTIGGGLDNTIAASAPVSFIGGGGNNRANGFYEVIGGGIYNSTYGGESTIGGGYANSASANSSTVGGGQYNTASGNSSTVGGGAQNLIQTNTGASTIAGGTNNTIQANTPYATIGGGYGNQVTGMGSFIGGGGTDGTYFIGNTNSSTASVVGGGLANAILAGATESTIGGGGWNLVQTNASGSTIGGGSYNTIQAAATASTIGGGYENSIQGNDSSSTIGGGYQNRIMFSSFSTICGGYGNQVTGGYGVVPGGDQNVASDYAFAAGHRAKANHQGSFVWADSTESDFGDTGINQFMVRASGGVTFNTSVFGSVSFTSGAGGANETVSWTPGSGSWSFTSDRNAKEHFQSLNVREVLAKVAQLPLTEWNYKGYDSRHIGPMAQDFHAAFPLNPNDTMLNSADESGVALAAIQGLNQKVEAGRQNSDVRIQRLEAENADLKQRLATLEQIVLKQKSN